MTLLSGPGPADMSAVSILNFLAESRLNRSAGDAGKFTPGAAAII
jgi:hypothetical protein